MYQQGHFPGRWCGAIVEQMDEEVLLAGADGKIVYANPCAAECLGIERTGLNLTDLFADDGSLARDLGQVAGTQRWTAIRLRLGEGPLAGAEILFRGRAVEGEEVGGKGILLVAERRRDPAFAELRTQNRQLSRDLAERRDRNAVLRRSLKSEERLHHELIHRVKNNLALLSALLGFRIRAASNPEVIEALSDFDRRIHAIRAVHDLLDRAGEIDQVQAGELIRALCAQLDSAFVPENVTLQDDLLDVTLGVEDATPLSLLVNELITNAVKHAFPGDREGRVKVELKKNGVDKLEVSIADDGLGEAADFERSGSGTRIVDALAAQIGGKLERHSHGRGTSWSFVFPHRNGDPRAAD
jgi:two-component sensor histidine kinase